MPITKPEWPEKVGNCGLVTPVLPRAGFHAPNAGGESRSAPAGFERSRRVSSALVTATPELLGIPRNSSGSRSAARSLSSSVALGLSTEQRVFDGKGEDAVSTNCAGCGIELGGRILRGEVLYADEIVTIFAKASRATVNRWLSGPLLSGRNTPGIRGWWITVAAFEADLKKLGCALELATTCPGCGGSLGGYLIRRELLDAQDIADYFSNRISLETVSTWFKRKLLRGRKTRGIRGYWTTSGEFLEDVRRLKGAPLAPRVVVAHG